MTAGWAHNLRTGEQFSVLGAGGFIGSHVVERLRRLGSRVNTPSREDLNDLPGDLGHVIYCIGVTGDFPDRFIDTVEAHTAPLFQLLRHGRFESLLYLSTARLYARADRTDECAVFTVDPSEPNGLYNSSKLTGEALCLNTDSPAVRIARLSNVYGRSFDSPNFLDSIIRDALRHGHIHLRTAMNSAKDYIRIDDVVDALLAIAVCGGERLYNIASGERTTHEQITQIIQEVTDCAVEVDADAPTRSEPTISIERIRGEFTFTPSRITDHLGELISSYHSPRKDAVAS